MAEEAEERENGEREFALFALTSAEKSSSDKFLTPIAGQFPESMESGCDCGCDCIGAIDDVVVDVDDVEG